MSEKRQLPVIPWLVQVAEPNETHCGPTWATIHASTSQDAAIAWMEQTPGWALPIRLRVAPTAKALRHPNGQPMISREFHITPA